MALEKITKFVFPISEIPKELVKGSWILDYPRHAFIEAHLDEETESDELDEWIIGKYPELVEEDSFFIYVDEQNN